MLFILEGDPPIYLSRFLGKWIYHVLVELDYCSPSTVFVVRKWSGNNFFEKVRGNQLCCSRSLFITIPQDSFEIFMSLSDRMKQFFASGALIGWLVLQ